MEQDSLNVTAKFKATVELLVDLHGTVACCLCRHVELLTALRTPWTFTPSQTVADKSFSSQVPEWRRFHCGFYKDSLCVSNEYSNYLPCFHISDRYIAVQKPL